MKNKTDIPLASTSLPPLSEPGGDSSARWFTREEVLHYEGRRYRSLDQRWVKKREEHIVAGLLKGLSGNNKCVLDLPCGYGRFTGLIRKQHMEQVCSDRAFEMVRRTAEKFDAPDVRGVTADAANPLPFRDQSFNIILCIRLFHHLKDSDSRAALLKEFHRVSSDWIIVSTYMFTPFHRLQRILRRIVRKNQNKIHMPSRREWNRQLSETGLVCVSEKSLLRGVHAQKFLLLHKG